jgi:hypothetical protein
LGVRVGGRSLAAPALSGRGISPPPWQASRLPTTAPMRAIVTMLRVCTFITAFCRGVSVCKRCLSAIHNVSQQVMWNKPTTAPRASFQARTASGVGSSSTRHFLRRK